MQLFRKSGYQATSMDDLVNHTGVSRYGIYTVFGGKKGLFLASLDAYRDGYMTDLMRGLEKPGASLEEINGFFRGFGSLAGTDEGKLSCLMCLTANQITGMDSEIDEKVEAHTKRLMRAFDKALKNAKKSQKIPKSIDVPSMSNYLIGLSHGLASLLRADSALNVIEPYLTVGLSVLEEQH